MTEAPGTHPQKRAQQEPPEVIGARASAFVELEIEPACRSLLQFTIVTAVCIALFIGAMALTIMWLQSWDLWSADCGGFVHGADRIPCPVDDSGY